MANPNQWIPPLPAGYEARWDPNQRAYFFINHVTRTTTWVDPRFTPGQQQHTAAAQSLNQQNMHAAGGQGQNVAMTTMFKQFGSTTTRDSASDDNDDEWENPADFDNLFASATDEPVKVDLMKVHEIKQSFPSASEDLIKSLLEKHNNAVVKTTNELYNKGHKRVAVSHQPPKMNDMLERLRAMFSDADPGLVEDMLSASNNDEKSARKLLEEMGYKPNFPATHRNKSARGSRQTTPSPAKSRDPSPKPVKQTLSEAEKQNRLRQLQNALPDTEKSVIEMALQVCEYDVERTKNVLGRMTNEPSRPSTSTSRPGTSARRSPSPTPALSPASVEPVSLFDDFNTSPTSRSSSRPSTTGVKKSSDSSSRPSTGKRTPTPKRTTPTHQGQQHRAKQVTQMSKDILSSTIATLNRISNNVGCCRQPLISDDTESSNQTTDTVSQSTVETQSHDDESTNESSASGPSVVSHQPQSREAYVSQYRTKPQGPNPALRAGPNKDLLLTEYSLAKGPNAELRVGPDCSRVQGSQGAVGPDRSLHCGPQLNLKNGPSTENLLVTAI